MHPNRVKDKQLWVAGAEKYKGWLAQEIDKVRQHRIQEPMDRWEEALRQELDQLVIRRTFYRS